MADIEVYGGRHGLLEWRYEPQKYCALLYIPPHPKDISGDYMIFAHILYATYHSTVEQILSSLDDFYGPYRLETTKTLICLLLHCRLFLQLLQLF